MLLEMSLQNEVLSRLRMLGAEFRAKPQNVVMVVSQEKWSSAISGTPEGFKTPQAAWTKV